MAKEVYTEAEMEVITFQVRDIITTSGTTEAPKPTGGGGGVVLPDDEW